MEETRRSNIVTVTTPRCRLYRSLARRATSDAAAAAAARLHGCGGHAGWQHISITAQQHTAAATAATCDE